MINHERHEMVNSLFLFFVSFRVFRGYLFSSGDKE
jgi:hypothetical protein